MSIQFEEAQRNIDGLIQWHKDHDSEKSRNEATTRLQLIDRLLFQCLGWDFEDCKAEDYYDGQFRDYSFHCPECLFILEAKKEGIYFELPVGSNKVKSDISFFLRHVPDVGKAIEQAIKYCQSQGAPYGAVCNGHQIIAFLGGRSDGHPALEGKALVFDSLETIQKNFLFFWQCLSKQGIMQRRLSTELLDTISAPLPDKLSERINGYPGFKRRNTLQTDLHILAELFVEDIARLGEHEEEQEFLKRCYCKSGALSQYAMISKDILRARYSALFVDTNEGPSIAPATTKKGLNPELFAQSLSRRPILLIGDVGVGKTMFIKNLYQVDAADIFSNAMVFYIDFASTAALDRELNNFILEDIDRQLLERYNIDIHAQNFVQGVLHGEIKRFEQSIYANLRDIAPATFQLKLVEYLENRTQKKDQYLMLCIRHIQKGHKKQIIIFLDNVDQRPHEFQEQVFLIGQSMAENWNVTVFISIRPETFYKSRMSGTLNAYHPEPLQLNHQE